jgi:hypothetical protein
LAPDELLAGAPDRPTISARRPHRAAESTTGNTDLRMFRERKLHAPRTNNVYVLSAANEGHGVYPIAEYVRSSPTR